MLAKSNLVSLLFCLCVTLCTLWFNVLSAAFAQSATRFSPSFRLRTLKLMMRANRWPGHLQVRDNLGRVNWCERLDGLEFKYDAAGNKKIESSFANSLTLV